MKSTVSGVVEDLKFKISEGSDQNWCFSEFAKLAVSALVVKPSVFLRLHTRGFTKFGIKVA